eukprot:TRINITY_DN10921_c0_g1_i1.p1 TRINITY_DN10921_c0_g1~~TRINITY_DN10921_c0_g1_i1.p1  ORF type:complete len:1542 (-),score=179.21 TRINITY_DN10921_c0_g1_i1:1412-6016(-)
MVSLLAVCTILLVLRTDAAKLSGSGSASVKSLINSLQDFMSSEFCGVNKTVDLTCNIVYNASTSRLGIEDLLAGRVDFAIADDAPSDADYAAAPDLQALPFVATPIIMAYNLPGLDQQLVLPVHVLSPIFNGSITRWDDTEIARFNPGVTLPAQPIIVVVRPAISGITSVFTSALALWDPAAWPVGGFSEPSGWPPSLQHVSGDDQSNTGLLRKVVATPFSLGYASVSLEVQCKFARLALYNSTNVTVVPDEVAIQEAAGEKVPDSKLQLSLLLMKRSNGKPVYPIVALTYFVVRNSSVPDRRNASLLVSFLHFSFTAYGRRTAKRAAFVPTPLALAQVSTEKAFQISVSGVRVRSIPVIQGCGSHADLWQSWASFFSFNAGIRVRYDTLPVVISRAKTVDSETDFAGSDFSLSTAEPGSSVLTGKDRELQLIPLYVIGVTLPYNVPSLTDLVITPAALVGIFNGSVALWNDPVLRASNPFANLPIVPITIVAPNGTQGLNEVLKRRLAGFNPQWQQEFGISASSVWPIASERLLLVDDASLIVPTIPYSIGVASLAQAIASASTVAAVTNVAGDVVLPSEFTLEAAVEGLTDPASPLNPGGYPLVGFGYALRAEVDAEKCDRGGLTSFLRYIMNEPSAITVAREKHFGSLPTSMHPYVETMLSQPLCAAPASIILGRGSPAVVTMVQMWQRQRVPRLPFQTILGLPDMSAVSNGDVQYSLAMVPPTAQQRLSAPNVLPVPLFTAPMVLVFNLPGITNILLPRSLLPLIMNGTISRWDDAALKLANPGTTLPSAQIILARRLGSTAPTFILSQALSSFDSNWNQTYGAFFFDKQWPQLPTAVYTAEMLPKVLATPYSLGYLFLSDVVKTNFTIYVATLTNFAGNKVLPSAAGISGALTGATLSSNLELVASDGKDPAAYPILSTVYFAFIPHQNSSCEQAKDLLDLALWILSDPHNSLAERLGFTGLQGEVRSQIRTQLLQCTCNGNLLRTDRIIPSAVSITQAKLHSLLASAYALQANTQIDAEVIPNMVDDLPSTLITGVAFPPQPAHLVNRLAIPSFATALAACYNLPGVPDLVLSPEVILGIYNGTYTTWNDAAISRLNPFAQLPNSKILVYVRTEASGNSIAIRSLFAEISPEWRKAYGITSSAVWPPAANVQAISGSDSGLATAVASAPFTLALVPLPLSASCTAAAVVNSLGYTVRPTPVSVAATVQDASPGETMTVVPSTSLNSNSYPLSFFSYYLLAAEWDNCRDLYEAVAFLRWTLSSPKALTLATSTSFVTPPPVYLQEGLRVLDTVRCHGQLVGPFNMQWKVPPPVLISDDKPVVPSPELSITDVLGQPAQELDSTAVELELSPRPLGVHGNRTFLLNGTAIFSELTVRGVHGVSYTFRVVVNSSRSGFSGIALGFEATADKCPQDNQFAVENSPDCKACPVGAVCNGSRHVVSQVGYWRSGDSSSLDFRKCSSEELCTGGDACRQGHSGPLCSVCDSGFGRNRNGVCTRCNTLRDSLYFLLAILVIVVWLFGSSGSISPHL